MTAVSDAYHDMKKRAEDAEAALELCQKKLVDALDKLRWVAQKKEWDLDTALSEAHLRTVAHEMLMVQLAEASMSRDIAIARAEAAEARLLALQGGAL